MGRDVPMDRLDGDRRTVQLDLLGASGDVPGQVGGISLYAHEGWRRYFSLVGPVATFGYWFAWSSVLALFGIVIGSLIQAEWSPGGDVEHRHGASRCRAAARDRGGRDHRRLDRQHLRHQPAVWLGLPHRSDADDPTRRLHRPPVLHGRLGQRQHDLDARRSRSTVGGLEDCSGLALRDGLVQHTAWRRVPRSRRSTRTRHGTHRSHFVRPLSSRWRSTHCFRSASAA